MSNDKFTKNSQKGIDLTTLLQFPDEGYVWLMYDGKDYKIPASVIKTAVINSGGNTYATITDLALKLDKIGGVIEKPHLGGGLETILAIKIDNSTNSIAFANGTSVNGVFIPAIIATVDTTGITGVGGINGNVPGGYWLTKVNDASILTEPAYRFDARDLSNQALTYRPLFGFGSANGDSFQVKANLDFDLLTHGIKNLKDPIDNQDAATKNYADTKLAIANNLSDVANRQTAVNNLFDATNLATGQTLIKDGNGNMVAGNAGGDVINIDGGNSLSNYTSVPIIDGND